MLQATCAEVMCQPYRSPIRRERFLDEMTRVVPWAGEECLRAVCRLRLGVSACGAAAPA